MRIRDREQDDMSEINLIPLIDVILCLIIFFVITTTFTSRNVLRLQLPRAEGEAPPQKDKPLSVLVNADGRYFVEDRESLRNDVETLKHTIAEVAGSDRSKPVLLRADARTPHQAVVTAYEALGQLGFRQVMIATAPQPKEGAPK
ncbi:MAG: biopolymer transporter ExbD [Proteobacteria bacterium]|nr:biopolymer transporter ExbD [Pseudomonadota bacterium]